MKKTNRNYYFYLLKHFVISFFICAVFASCASLQEDVMVSSGETEALVEAEDFENRFWEIDSALVNGQEVSAKEMEKYVSDVEKKITSHTEPVLASRLYALEGLVLQMNSKIKKAQDCYEKGKALHSGDEYILLLAARFNEGNENNLSALSTIEEYLTFDGTNPVFLLEKGILLYKTGDYTQSVATIDKAFLLFDEEDENHKFRENFGEFRNTVWKLHSSGIQSSDDLNISKVLVKDRMILLTMERTGLFEDLLGGMKPSVKELNKKLEAAGYYTAPGDKDGSLDSILDITQSSFITRTLCARFLWNAYVRQKGNMKLLNAYSTRFSRLKDPHSPIEDLPLSSLDFDAVLGTVEKEIINLTDGILFEGDKAVTELEFLEFLNSCENALR